MFVLVIRRQERNHTVTELAGSEQLVGGDDVLHLRLMVDELRLVLLSALPAFHAAFVTCTLGRLRLPCEILHRIRQMPFERIRQPLVRPFPDVVVTDGEPPQCLVIHVVPRIQIVEILRDIVVIDGLQQGDHVIAVFLECGVTIRSVRLEPLPPRRLCHLTVARVIERRPLLRTGTGLVARPLGAHAFPCLEPQSLVETDQAVPQPVVICVVVRDLFGQAEDHTGLFVVGCCGC